MVSETVRAKAAAVRLLALDSDGVLTNGGVYMFDDGREFRRFNIKDGLGIKQVMAAGITVAIISSASSQAVQHRARQLGVGYVYVGVGNKLELLRSLCHNLHIALEHVAYMGDDLADLAVMQHVGLPCAPADAVRQVRETAAFVSSCGGGYGAVRELCDYLLEARAGDDSAD